MKQSLLFTLIGLALLALGIVSFLTLGAFGNHPTLGIVFGLGCIIAAIVFVNKGDPSKLPQSHCWACGRSFDHPPVKKEE